VLYANFLMPIVYAMIACKGTRKLFKKVRFYFYIFWVG
jgi:hypothetical protein